MDSKQSNLITGVGIDLQTQMKFSIITINYNNYEGLLRTIGSVIDQTHQNFEYIIVDGGSTDGSLEVIKRYESHLSNWVSEPDRGIYHAMNKGIEKAKGDYVLFLNSGDFLSSSEILEKVSEFKFKVDIVYGDGLFQTDKGKFTPMDIPEKLNLEYLFSSSLCHPSTFIKKNLFELYGLYDETLSIVSDWDFFLKTIVMHGVTTKKVPMTISQMEDGGISRNKNYQALLKKEIDICRNRYFSKMIIELIDDYCLLKKKRSVSRLFGSIK